MLNKIVLFLLINSAILPALALQDGELFWDREKIQTISQAYSDEGPSYWSRLNPDGNFEKSPVLLPEVQKNKETLYFFSLSMKRKDSQEKTYFFKITAISETEDFIGFKLQALNQPMDQTHYNNLCLYINEVPIPTLENIYDYLIFISAKHNLEDRIPIPLIPLPFSLVPVRQGGIKYAVKTSPLNSNLETEKVYIQFTNWLDNLEEYTTEIEWKNNFHACKKGL